MRRTLTLVIGSDIGSKIGIAFEMTFTGEDSRTEAGSGLDESLVTSSFDASSAIKWTPPSITVVGSFWICCLIRGPARGYVRLARVKVLYQYAPFERDSV